MSVLVKKTSKLVDGAMYVFAVLACLAIPFVMDLALANPFVLPKQIAALLLAMVGIGFWLVRATITKKISFSQSVLDKMFGLFFVTLLVSVVLSSDRVTSLVGRADYFAASFSFLAAGWIIFAFCNQTIISVPRWQGVVDTLMGAGAISALAVAAKILVSADALSFITGGRWSTIDPANSLLGLWLGLVFLIAASQLLKKGIPLAKSLLCLITMAASFTVLLIMNYTMMWWLLIVGLVAFIAISSLYIREARLGVITAYFGIVLAIIIMLTVGVPKISAVTVQPEVVLNNTSSFTVAWGSLFFSIKNSLFGNGPGTFLLAFSHFRDSSFNADPYAWSVRFNQPYSTFMSLLAEGGLITTILFLVIVLMAIGYVAKALKQASIKRGGTVHIFADGSASTPPLMEVMLLSVVWIMSTVGMFLFFYGPVLWWVWWILLSCVVTGLAFTEDAMFQTREHRFIDKPEYTLSLSFVAITISALMIVGAIWGARWYWAEKAFTRALASTSPEQVEKELHLALEYYNKNEQYHIALARLYLLKATQLSQQPTPDIQAIGKLVEQAVSESRQASDLNPRSVVVWENLGLMYENAATLIPEARAWAIKSFDQASQLEPTNPVLKTKLGDNQALSGNYTEAVKKLEEAIALKRDYAPAYVSLGLVYEQMKNLEKTAQTYASLAQLEPTNIEYAYNYGRALYNRNTGDDRAVAERIWLNIIAAEPRYSNAIFSLASLNEVRGNRAKALEYYRRVLELNPGNKDIKAKITNLSR